MATDIKTKKDADLTKEIKQKHESLRKFRFGASGSKVKNVKEGRNLKKDIARMHTELRRRQLENK